MLASLQFVFANSLAQHITLNLRNARLEDVFKSIADQSQYKFLYNDDVLAKAPRISMTVTNKPLEEVLNRVVARNGLAYKIMANTILVSVPSFEVSKNERTK
ncbi:STN domain-containing protein [Sphingobacterium sp. T2]|uniref:STN domain-containing protein n=1 Tax=Sphingobacterium sp. T2 TaxID=1590596 RepID=UPI0018CED086|nr:STN domain-containing protein [Sphingobacterium sp. T2]